MKLKFNIKKPSFFWLLLPFLFILDFPHNLLTCLFLSLFVLVIFDLLLLKYLNKKSLLFSFTFLSFFFYAFIIYKDSLHVVHEMRFRHFSVLFLFFVALFYYAIIFIFKSFKFINVFLLIFSITIITKPLIIDDKSSLLNRLKPSFEWSYKNYNKSKEPIVLIILDELSSSDEIFKFTKDSIDFELEEELSKMNFYIRDPFPSLSTHTRYSLPSIFNFNLHTSQKIQTLEKNSILRTADEDMIYLFERNLLVDSLKMKSVSSHSYGLLPFINSNINTKNFKYPWGANNDNINFLDDHDFLNLIMKSSTFGFFYKIYTNSLIIGSEKDNFRKQVIDKLVSEKFSNNSFYYFHLFMPHYPFSYFDEYPPKVKPSKIIANLDFENRSQENLRGNEFNKYMSTDRYLLEHIEYRRFSTKKILSFLKLEKFNESRIIIVGDHGFRGTGSNAKKINPLLTSIYTRGFDAKDIISLNSVQDLSYLILNSF